MTILNNLVRYPKSNDPTLQAWDASDELVLEHIPSIIEKYSTPKILIMNDSFGALSILLKEYKAQNYVDSYNSAQAINTNNNEKPIIINDLENIQGFFDIIVLKIPKNMSFMEDILIKISKHMHEKSTLICSAMVKHLPKKSFELLNQYIGDTSTSLAKKKARLVFANYQKSPAQDIYPLKIKIDQWDKELINHSNLFSREKLDIGTRFFLENIPQGHFKSILDLGCANGLIGLKAKSINPNAKIYFSDESFMAIKSAKDNYKNSFNDEAEFYWTNCYEDKSFPKVDLVLCNPPFHQGNTVGDFIALQMFKDSRDALNQGGKIRVIGNNHLGYHVKLKKLFGNVTEIKKNKKFIILESTK